MQSLQNEASSIEKTDEETLRQESLDSLKKPFDNDRSNLSQSLDQRHLQMIAFVHIFGTGIFLSSGASLATAGPLGVILAYLIVGIIVGCNQMAMCEVSCLFPVSSATVRHLEHFVDDSLGFAYGWLIVWSSIMPGELSSTAVIISYWTSINPSVWISIIIVLIILMNSYTVRFYAEVEFFFGILKLMLLVGLIIMSIVITSGGAPDHTKIGFKYWKEFGLFNDDYLNLKPKPSAGFAGWYKALSSTVYSYGGVQSIPSLAAEVKYPRRSIYISSKRIFIKVLILSLLMIFLLTLIVSASNKEISTNTGTAKSSPFVIAAQNSGIHIIPHIINAIVLTSAFSATNTYIIHGSRTLFALASKNQAPSIFMKTNRRGLPYIGVGFVIIFMPLAYMSISEGSDNVFNWFQRLSSTNLLVGWIFISINHIQLSRAMKIQGYSRDQLPHTFKYTEIASWFSGILSFVLLITNGFTNFIHGNFKISSFISDYITIVIFIILFIGWKLYKKTKFKKLHEIDLISLFDDVSERPEPKLEPLRGWKLITVLWS